MTTPTHETPIGSRALWLRPFLRHYLEMVIAMIVGMIALGPVESWLVAALDWSAVLDRPDVNALAMATNMTLSMGVWMRYRGHSWAPIAEMSAAMYVPFLVLLVPLWLGVISAGALMLAGHVLMLLGMAAAMLARRDEYTSAHCTRA